ncbi:MAG: hypothetical protein ACM3U2_07715 [Deltaproteobacteria bacterium]
MIRYQCAECGAALNIKDELAGTQGHCPRCQVEFTVPAAEGTPVAEKEPAAVAGEAPAKERERAAGGLSDDDIGAILAAPGPSSSTAAPGTPGYGFDDEEEESDDEPRKKRREPQLEDTSEDDEADHEESDEAARRPKKKGKPPARAAAKTDSAESASIAKSLMARGEHAVVREEKKGGRPFGGTEGRGEERPDYTARDIVKYFAAIGWPAVAGLVVLVGLCFGIYKWLSPGVNLPPLAEVSGTVTLDGKPLEKAVVEFRPTTDGPSPNLNLATSFGITDQDGKYSLTYLVIDEKRIPGAVIGKHLVVIRATDKRETISCPRTTPTPPRPSSRRKSSKEDLRSTSRSRRPRNLRRSRPRGRFYEQRCVPYLLRGSRRLQTPLPGGWQDGPSVAVGTAPGTASSGKSSRTTGAIVKTQTIIESDIPLFRYRQRENPHRRSQSEIRCKRSYRDAERCPGFFCR